MFAISTSNPINGTLLNTDLECEMMTKTKDKDIGKILAQRRKQSSLTMRDVAIRSGVSTSHLSRIEHGDRFPSASVLRRLAAPLGFQETELMMIVGYLSPLKQDDNGENVKVGKLDPYVALVLSKEPVEMQRALVDILKIVKRVGFGNA